MSDHKNLWIGGLALSAVILGSTLLLLNRPALAEGGLLDKGGDYTMCTGLLTAGGDGVYIIDAQMGKLIMYRLQAGVNKLIIGAPLDLKASSAVPPKR